MATGDHPFPMLAWSGVTHPYQGIQQWRMYGHAGAGTENTGWRNYGAVGYNTSDGAGTRGAWFKEGTPVQRTQYRAPNAGVSQRFTGDQIRPNTPPPFAQSLMDKDAINNISAGFKARKEAKQAEAAEAQKQAWLNTPTPFENLTPQQQAAIKQAQMNRQQGASQPTATVYPRPSSTPSRGYSPDIPQYTPEQRQQMAAEQRAKLGMPERTAPAQPAQKPLTPLQQGAIAQAEQNRRQRLAPPAEKLSTSRVSKRAQKSAIGAWGRTLINTSLELG